MFKGTESETKWFADYPNSITRKHDIGHCSTISFWYNGFSIGSLDYTIDKPSNTITIKNIVRTTWGYLHQLVRFPFI